MKSKILVLALLVIFISMSCKNGISKISKEEMRKIVESQNEKLSNCFKEGNAEKLALMYADSAKLCPNGYHFVVGRDSIKAFWAEDFKSSKTLEMKTTVLTIDGNEDVIYETGKASSKFLIADSIYNATVKYINVWRKQKDGSYKLDIDFWNKDEKKP